MVNDGVVKRGSEMGKAIGFGEWAKSQFGYFTPWLLRQVPWASCFCLQHEFTVWWALDVVSD